jgi:hypothetical protein
MRDGFPLAQVNARAISIAGSNAQVGGMRPTLVANPVTDRTFRAFAEQQLDEGATTIAELQKRLRVRYPHAVIHARELTAEPTLIWYVYRDGHWMNAGDAGS